MRDERKAKGLRRQVQAARRKRIAALLSYLLAGGFLLAGCGSGSASGAEPGIVYQGVIGDSVQTEWFAFRVEGAHFLAPSEYPDYAAPEGYGVLEVALTLQNTFQKSVPMYLYDFQLQWGDGEEGTAPAGASDFAWPIPGAYLTLGESQLPDEYDLKVGETRTGTILYEVPAGERDFQVAFEEVYEDGGSGNTYFLSFTAE